MDSKGTSTYMSFRIFGPSLDPSEVSIKLGLEPDHIHLAGDYPKGNPRGKVEQRPYKHGMWSLNSKLSPSEPFKTHLESILSVLEPRQSDITIYSENMSVDIICDIWGPSGIDLSPQMISRMASLGIGFGATLYPDSQPNSTIERSV